MVIDDLFIKCEVLADKYDTNLLNVLSIYTTIEQIERTAKRKYDINTIYNLTEKYFIHKNYEEEL